MSNSTSSTDGVKHTAGPWVVKFRNDHSAYISLGNPQSGPHKQFDIAFDDRDPSDVADARLIAAAPELLAALKAVLATGNRVPITVKDAHKLQDEIEAAGKLARAAIAKATGEQS